MYKLLIAGICVIPLISGCTTDRYDYNVYQSSQAKRELQVTHGIVKNIRQVKIKKDTSGINIGSVGGAVLGGIGGSAIGQGVGTELAEAAGAIAGFIVGDQVEQSSSETGAYEVTVYSFALKREIVVVQGGKPDFKIGDKVSIISDYTSTRINK